MVNRSRLVVTMALLLVITLTICYFMVPARTRKTGLILVDNAKLFPSLKLTANTSEENVFYSSSGNNHSHSHQYSNKRTQASHSNKRTEASHSNKRTEASPSNKRTEANSKEIMLATKMDGEFANEHFIGCEYSNCVFRFTDSLEEARKVDVIISEFNSGDISTLRRKYLQSDQLLIAFSHESPAYEHNRWGPSLNTDLNGTMSYRYNEPMRYPWGLTLHTPTNTKPINYSKGKSKGAYAYVSNCYSKSYGRIKLMKQLAKYVNLDIFGHCNRHIPCSKKDFECETRVHSKYRFYLAFENSLCKDYITEKFWKALNSTANYVPVAMGGLSVEDYSRIAPPDSFLHVNNFTSIQQLGAYLQHLMDDEDAYNRYHQWKSQYKAVISDQHGASCDICKVAHNPELLRKYQTVKLADEWNKKSNCRTYNGAFSLASSSSKSMLLVQSQAILILVNPISTLLLSMFRSLWM